MTTLLFSSDHTSCATHAHGVTALLSSKVSSSGFTEGLAIGTIVSLISSSLKLKFNPSLSDDFCSVSTFSD